MSNIDSIQAAADHHDSATAAPNIDELGQNKNDLHGSTTVYENEHDNNAVNSSHSIISGVGHESKPPAQTMSTAAIAVIMTSLCLSSLLSSLDLTIFTPAIPAIVADLNATNGYIWIGGAFILAYTSMTTIWAGFSNVWGRRPIILNALTIFLVGSMLCALAPTMNALIAGRVIQGLGASGLSVLVNVVIADIFSLRDRGLYLAITSLVWAVGSTIGPVIGGIFTTRVSWRWCFWVNLPIGGAVWIVMLLYLKLQTPRTSIWQGLKYIDWAGTVLVIGGALMILLGLDLGGELFPWTSATVVNLVVFGVVVIAIFFFNEWKLARDPIIPLRLFSTFKKASAYGVLGCNSYVNIGLAYYLPLYSQAVRGSDALVSGVELLPLIVSSALSGAFSGVIIQRTGIYRPLMHIAQVFLILGTGLFVDIRFGEGLAKLFIFQILTGIGVGLNIEGPVLAAQAASPVRDTAAVTATMGFVRSIATAVSVVIGGVIFQNEMTRSNPGLQTSIGRTNAELFDGHLASANIERISALPPADQTIVRETYLNALRRVWIMYVAFAGLSGFLNFFVGTFHLSKEHMGAVLGADRQKEDSTLHKPRMSDHSSEKSQVSAHGGGPNM